MGDSGRFSFLTVSSFIFMSPELISEYLEGCTDSVH